MIPKTVVACEALRLEFEAVAGPEVRLRFMDVALHRFPQKMPGQLAEAVAEVESQGPTEIILGYGLCSNGVAGLSGTLGLRMARCHDCVGIILGSPKKYLEVFHQYPGTFFLFAGLMAANFDPVSILEREHVPRLGRKKALRGMELALKNYTHFAYIENGVRADPDYRARFEENCRVFGKEPLELSGDLSYVRALIHGPRSAGDFLELAGGQAVNPADFF